MKRCSIALMMTLAASAWCGDPGNDRKALEGIWKPSAAEFAGAKLPEAELGNIALVIADGKYSVQVGKTVDKGTFKLDPAAKPKTMDIIGTDGPNKGKTMLAIYEINKDTLRVCYDVQGKNRPTEFATSKEKQFFLAVYQRAKP